MDLEQFLIFAGLALLFCKSDSQITAQAPNEDSNQLRLVDGPGRCAGRVEIYHGARWGTICDDSWDKADADVVCKQLGCGHGVKATTGVYYGRGTGDIWLDGVECRGNETHIRDCPAQPFGDHNCDNEENAGVLCSGHIQYQLFDGPHRCSGYLVVQHGETWESVCEIDAELKTANVLCRELNCGEAVQTSWTFRRPGPIWSEQFHCVGNESRLYDCSRQDREGNCTKQVPAVIKCKAPVRLSGGDTECEGLMEVKYQEEWWGVNFYTSPGEIIANVVCRELGCETTNVQHRATRGKIFMDVYRRKMHIQCMSEPFSISQCKQYIYDGLHPSVDLIGVKCSGHKEYRLVNGPHQCSGYLVARHGNTWGSVCEIDEELKAATVFCRQLRCGEAVPTLLNGTRIPGLIWREQINCVGNESSLYDCIRRDIGGNCTKQRPPAIECKGYLSPVRLSGGNTECEGLVEVRYKEEWWGVDYYIISREKIADVVCRELGCNTTNVQPRVTRGEIFVDDRRRILDLRCTGEESILSHCEYKTYNNLHHSLFMIGVKCSVHEDRAQQYLGWVVVKDLR
ncbi:scavenger receptor cysteine-rich type 1 protein M130-like [Eleutherodactylus coqui]|uniref:scavenger receptor cysteine-rich type 1 protein M130-like n=1 Tax=Eleutherodactylus coqui TaxID=57060 RepID=UPI0034629ACE